MIISVEQKHIKMGQRHSPTCCPIALAVKGHTGYTPSVRSNEIRTAFCTVPLSRSAQRFVNNFDQGKSVKPFRFKLEEVHAD